jgi:predicted SprT family Zn-dependent metalloprotease
MKRETKKYNYDYIEKTKEEYEIDKILGKHVLSHLQYFFNDNKISKKNKSRKNNMNTITSTSTSTSVNSNKTKKNKTRKQF